MHKNVLAARSTYFRDQIYPTEGSPINYLIAEDYDKQSMGIIIKACYGEPIEEATLDEHIAEQILKFAIIICSIFL